MARRHVIDRPYARNISYSVAMRGNNDDEPWLVFIGAEWDFLKQVFSWLVAGGHTAKGFTMVREHSVMRRNGFSYWRTAIHLEELNEDFCSMDELRLIVESRIRAGGHNVKYYADYEQFVNI